MGRLPGHRGVGWSIVWALARCPAAAGVTSVVLDGVARGRRRWQGTRLVAAEEGAQSLVVMTRCADPDVHRARVEGRRRHIPNWYELEWEHVARARRWWVAPGDVDLVLEATDPVDMNAATLRKVIGSLS